MIHLSSLIRPCFSWLIFLTLLASSLRLPAQCYADPSLSGEPGFHLRAWDECIYPNSWYQANVTYTPPKQVLMGNDPMTVTGMEIDRLLNLPPGLAFSCNWNQGCRTDSGEQNCIELTGMLGASPGVFQVDVVANVDIIWESPGFPPIHFSLLDTLFDVFTIVVREGDPDVSIATSDASCIPNGTAKVEITGGYPPFQYDWGRGFTAADSASDLRAGDHGLYYRDSLGCILFESFTVGRNEDQPPVIEPTATLSWKGCVEAGEGRIAPEVHGGNGPLRYTWSDGSEEKVLTGVQPGPQQLTVTDSLGCQAQRSYELTAPDTLLLAVTEKVPAHCQGSATAALFTEARGGHLPYEYTWHGQAGKHTAALENVPAGSYTLEVADAIGCVKTLVATLSEPEPLRLRFEVSDATYYGARDGQVVARPGGGWGGYQFAWAHGPQGPKLNQVQPGSYQVTVTDSLGCAYTDSVTVGSQSPLSLEARPNQLRLYPNPSRGWLRGELSLPQASPLTLRLTDLQGKTLESRTLPPAQHHHWQLDLGPLPPGSYLLQLQAGAWQTQKLLQRVP